MAWVAALCSSMTGGISFVWGGLVGYRLVGDGGGENGGGGGGGFRY